MLNTMYGVFSEKQSKLTGIFIYLIPDGTKVACTEVGSKRGAPGSVFDDKVDLGEVTKFVRKGY